jgi:hypothetical protein
LLSTLRCGYLGGRLRANSSLRASLLANSGSPLRSLEAQAIFFLTDILLALSLLS